MLLTMQEAYVRRAKFFPNPERLDRVNEVIFVVIKILYNFLF